MKHHVLTSIGHIIGEAETEEEAAAVCKAEGFTPIGHVDFISPDLAAEELGYECGGDGVFVVICEDTGSDLPAPNSAQGSPTSASS